MTKKQNKIKIKRLYRKYKSENKTTIQINKIYNK